MQRNFDVFLVDSSEDPPRAMALLPAKISDEESGLRLAMIILKTLILDLELAEEDFVSIYLLSKELKVGEAKVDGTLLKVAELPFGTFVQGVTLTEEKAGPYYRNTKDFGKDIRVNGQLIHLMPPICEDDN